MSPHTAVSSRIIGIRKTAGGHAAEEPGPIEGAATGIFVRQYWSDQCMSEAFFERPGAQSIIAWILMQDRRKQKGSKEPG